MEWGCEGDFSTDWASAEKNTEQMFKAKEHFAHDVGRIKGNKI